MRCYSQLFVPLYICILSIETERQRYGNKQDGKWNEFSFSVAQTLTNYNTLYIFGILGQQPFVARRSTQVTELRRFEWHNAQEHRFGSTGCAATMLMMMKNHRHRTRHETCNNIIIIHTQHTRSGECSVAGAGINMRDDGEYKWKQCLLPFTFQWISSVYKRINGIGKRQAAPATVDRQI